MFKPWIVARSMDPLFAQYYPRIVLIRTLRITYIYIIIGMNCTFAGTAFSLVKIFTRSSFKGLTVVFLVALVVMETDINLCMFQEISCTNDSLSISCRNISQSFHAEAETHALYFGISESSRGTSSLEVSGTTISGVSIQSVMPCNTSTKHVSVEYMVDLTMFTLLRVS